MKRFIVTGASGHIGNNLVKTAEKLFPEAEITAFTRRTVAKELDGTKCTQVIGDICDEKFLSENIKDGDTVVHLAALIDLTDKKKEETYKVNFLAAKKICDVCFSKKDVRFIYVGSVDAIAKTGDGKISEPDGYFPEKIEGNYGKTKAMATNYVLGKMKENESFPAAIVLPSAVVGINDFKPSAVGKVFADTLSGKPEFGIKGGYNFVDVEDVCRVILTLCENKKRGQYIVSGENVSVREVYGKINAVTGRKSRPIIIPTGLVYLFLPFVKVLNKITLKSLSEPHDYDSSKAKKELGFIPTPIDETFEKTVKWFERSMK